MTPRSDGADRRGVRRYRSRTVLPAVWVQGPGCQSGVSRGCPVSAECLDYAPADPHLVGVWGGTSDLQRKQHHQLRKVLA